MRSSLIAVLVIGGGLNLTGAQTHNAPGLKPGERAEILFAAETPPSDPNVSGDPAFSTLEPIAFVVDGQLRQCDSSTSESESTAARRAVLGLLQRAYTPGRRYSLWQGGAPWGWADAVKSCIDENVQLMAGCFRFRPDKPRKSAGIDFPGIAFTAPSPASSHPAQRVKAGTQERAIFLEAVSAALRERYAVRVPVLRIRPGAVWKTQLRADRMAIAGSALLQIPAQDPGTYHSYRVFAVLEEEQGQYQPVLTSLRKSIINLGEGMQTTKLGEELDEGEQTDKEEFFDNFPVFAGEPDAVITRHYFYEAWSFSIYRWRNGLYHRVYTGCGGGV